jgi:hypothetical protein
LFDLFEKNGGPREENGEAEDRMLAAPQGEESAGGSVLLTSKHTRPVRLSFVAVRQAVNAAG